MRGACRPAVSKVGEVMPRCCGVDRLMIFLISASIDFC
jgi:hypothetical protein